MRKGRALELGSTVLRLCVCVCVCVCKGEGGENEWVMHGGTLGLKVVPLGPRSSNPQKGA